LINVSALEARQGNNDEAPSQPAEHYERDANDCWGITDAYGPLKSWII